MDEKHQVTITINGGYVKGEEILYIYSNANEASVILMEQAATIMFTTAFDLGDEENLDSYSITLFQDAYRKIHLIHLFAKGCTVQVKRIDLLIDNLHHWVMNERDEDFPYIISMLEGHHFDLCDKWRNEHVYDVVSLWPVVASEHNLLHCAVSAFLSSKTRRYYGDRLIDLWTALNSYYSYLTVCFENTEAETEGVDRSDLPSAFRSYGNDAPCIGVLLMRDFHFFCGKHLLEGDMLDGFCLRALKYVAGLKTEHLSEIYEETVDNFQNIKKGGYVPDELYDIATELKVPLHLFLLVFLSYYLRCELVHGSRSVPILVNYYDEHLLNYRVCCFYLERFLNSNIPEMFQMNDRVSEQEREMLVCYLRMRNKSKDGLKPEDAQRFGVFLPEYAAKE